MTMVHSVCWSRQGPAITRPDRIVRNSCSSGRLQQPVVSLPGLSGLATSRIDSASSLGSGIGLAGSVRWRSSKTCSTTCMLHEASPELRADGSSSLVVEQNFGQGRHSEAGASASPALSTDKIALAAAPRQLTPSIPDVRLIHKVRAILFYATTYSLLSLTSLVQMIMHPFVLAFDRQHRAAHYFVTKVWATLSTRWFFKIEIEGRENLPAVDKGGVVFVSNHQSNLDNYPMQLLGRPFRIISKSSSFQVPVLGLVMHMAGHIPLLRDDPKSTLMCLKECMNVVKDGVAVLFFPEGTTSPDGTLGDFKKGAFKVAAREGVPVVPITVVGSSKLMPKGFENILRSGVLKLVIHPPISSKNADELCKQSRKIIAETLQKHGYSVS